MIRQYLSNQVKRFNRDTKAEQTEAALPDRQKIKDYLANRVADPSSSDSESDSSNSDNEDLQQPSVGDEDDILTQSKIATSIRNNEVVSRVRDQAKDTTTARSAVRRGEGVEKEMVCLLLSTI